MPKYKLMILESQFTIHKLDPNKEIPLNDLKGQFYWIGKTNEELSIICESTINLTSKSQVDNWSIIKIDETLDFSLVGVLADISAILKEAGITLLAQSTFNTDYIMIQKPDLAKAKGILTSSGYTF